MSESFPRKMNTEFKDQQLKGRIMILSSLSDQALRVVDAVIGNPKEMF